MAKAKALSTFRMGKNLIRRGSEFESDADHIAALERNRLAELIKDGPDAEPQATKLSESEAQDPKGEVVPAAEPERDNPATEENEQDETQTVGSEQAPPPPMPGSRRERSHRR